MAANINNFLATFKDDLAKPSRFEVVITPTNPILSGIMSSSELIVRCENAVLPGRTMETADLTIYGPVEKYPYRTSYEDITLTFICTDAMKEKKFFNTWMEIINPQESWDFAYKATYRSNIEIRQYDNANKIVHSVYLMDAFPTAVNQLDLDWSSSDTYHKLSVVFAYTYWSNSMSSSAMGAAPGRTVYDFYAAQLPNYLQNVLGPNFNVPAFPPTLSSIANAIPGVQGITVVTPIGPSFTINL